MSQTMLPPPEKDSRTAHGPRSSRAARATKPNSDHRKEQNRIASHNYRQRRKLKLALLDRLLEPEGPSEVAIAGGEANHRSDNVDRSDEPRNIIADDVLPNVDFGDAPIFALDPFMKLVRREKETTTAFVPPLSTIVVPRTVNADATTSTTNASAVAAPAHRLRASTDANMRDVLVRVQNLSERERRLLAQMLLEEDGADGGTENDSRAIVDRSFEELDNVDGVDDDHDRVNENASAENATASSLATLTTRHSYGMLPFSEITGTAPWLQTGGSTAHAAPVPPLSFVTLHFRRHSLRSALLHNCLACGLVNPALMFTDGPPPDDYPDRDPDADDDEDWLQSPFSLSVAEARAVARLGPADRHTVVATVANARHRLDQAGTTLPPDLVPVDAQILIRHHPYLDVIPFPEFRRRTLLWAFQIDDHSGFFGENGDPAWKPFAFDDDELCYDLDTSNGLICWGGLPGSDSDRLSVTERREAAADVWDMRYCVPWDKRSWEPQIWFLKKYWFLVGGWDDDMWRSCRWWHGVRGEHLDYSVFASKGY